MRKSSHIKTKSCTVKRAMAAHCLARNPFLFSPAAFLRVCYVLSGWRLMLAHLATLSQMWFVGRDGLLCLGLSCGQCQEAGSE